MRWTGTVAALVAVTLGLLVSTGCSDDDDAEAVRPSEVTRAETTTTVAPTTIGRPAVGPPALEREVEAAYLRSWDVYARAVYTFDPSELDEVYADDALALTLDEIEDRRAKDLPSRVSVEHDYRISFLSPTLALVGDSYRNHSVLLDPRRASRSSPIRTRSCTTPTP